MLSEFHQRERLSKAINATILYLIPKIQNPVFFKDYRPISLIGCIYKPLSKILANRLERVLPHIISPPQGAFIQNRQILDGILIANEFIHSRKRADKEGVISKIDWKRLVIMSNGIL